jgi:hypothetical protein
VTITGRFWVTPEGYLVRHQGKDAALFLGPLMFALAASISGLYPFRGRLILFLVPNLFLALAAGIEAIIRVAARFGPLQTWREGLFWGAALVIGVRPLWKVPPPYYDSETKPMICYLGQHRRDGDAIYVHNMAWKQFAFYGPAESLRTDQATETSEVSLMLLGPKPLVILRDLDKFRGRSRVWILFGGSYTEELSVAYGYIDTIGRLLDCRTAFNASIYLYDFSDPSRLASAAAEDFVAHPRSARGCGDR